MEINYMHLTEVQLQLGERRRELRVRDLNLFLVTKNGTAQILDLSIAGLSFGCLYYHIFPGQLKIDIINPRGIHIKQLAVRKMWERAIVGIQSNENYEQEVGVEFINLSVTQEKLLTLLIDESIQYQTTVASEISWL